MGSTITEVLPVSGAAEFGVRNMGFGAALYPTPWRYKRSELDKTVERLSGQNMTTPQEKLFGRHYPVNVGGVYHDPSYGTTHSGPAAFASAAVDAWTDSSYLYYAAKQSEVGWVPIFR